MNDLRLPKAALPATAAALREALDEGAIRSQDQLHRRLDALGVPRVDRMRTTALALGTGSQRLEGSSIGEVAAALGLDVATLRATAEKEMTRLIARAPHLESHGDVAAWMDGETGAGARAEAASIEKPAVMKAADALSQAVQIATAPLGQMARASAAARADRRILKAPSGGEPTAISVGRDDFDAELLTAEAKEGLRREAHDAVSALLDRPVRIVDAETAELRSLTREDVAQTHATIDDAFLRLAQIEVKAGPNLTPFELLTEPATARAVLPSEPSPAALTRWRQSLSVLQQADGEALSKSALKRAEQTRKGLRSFNDKVLAQVGRVPSTVRVADSDRPLRLETAHVTDLVAATRPLVDGLVGVSVGLEDPRTGLGRAVTAEDVDITHRVIDQALRALEDTTIEVDAKTLSLDSILATPQVAAKILEYVAPANAADREAFMTDYHRAVGTLLAQREAYYLKTSWPGLTDPAETGMPDGTGPVVIAVRRTPPADVTAAMEQLTHSHFEGITHLWFDELMSESPEVRAKSEARLAAALDEPGRALLNRLVAYRDQDASRVIAVQDGQRARYIEVGLGQRLEDLTRSVAHRTAKSAYYNGIADGMGKEVLKVVGIGTVLGKGLDYASSLLNNPGIEFWKPTVLGGWDDVLGGWVNVRELMDVADKFPDPQIRADRKAGAFVDGVFAVAGGVGSSVALGLPLLSGKSLGEAILAPGVDALTRAGASAVYGAASSGATALLSILPARHHYRPILNLVDRGVIDPPTDKGGEPLEGRPLRNWARRQAMKAHLSYTAQFGGALGVGTSAVFMAAMSPVLGLQSALMSNVVLSLGGAFETITTGAVLFGRQAFEDWGLRRSFRRAIDEVSAGGPSAGPAESS